jgi:hypothetical protein
MKKIILLIFLLVTSLNYSQETKSSKNQKYAFDEANRYLKSNQPEKASEFFYYTNKMNPKSKLGQIALKKGDSIIHQKIKSKIIGTWTLFESGSNWGFKDENKGPVKKILTITNDDFQFYEYDIETKVKKLVKTEKLAFEEYKDPNESSFDFVFSDKSLWAFYFDKERNILRQMNTGEQTAEGRTEIVCGNSELNYIKED